ncbi:hypothetical protein B0T24DRAFT_323492 [Lasiosphaeria ovina]|uniref:Uncharacterized protein n=1 Tax=Lasiosphaeria ovina TaxID=92902 RepID=A0AAE0K7B1_9PEZI|nr:hypothetical protein B0T24DRAFT_323492 [Lasiosphaeria ovina]
MRIITGVFVGRFLGSRNGLCVPSQTFTRFQSAERHFVSLLVPSLLTLVLLNAMALPSDDDLSSRDARHQTRRLVQLGFAPGLAAIKAARPNMKLACKQSSRSSVVGMLRTRASFARQVGGGGGLGQDEDGEIVTIVRCHSVTIKDFPQLLSGPSCQVSIAQYVIAARSTLIKSAGKGQSGRWPS